MSRGPIVGAIVAIALAVPPAAAPQPHLVARKVSALAAPLPPPVSAPTPRWPAPRIAAASPPAPHVARAALRIPPKKIPTAPVAPTRIVVGTGQWGLINQDRRAAGLPPLQWNDCLASVAKGQAARMAAQGYISHANGRTLDLGCHLGTRSGENIGYQGGSIDDAAMNAWFMGDAPHRANILGPYHYVGVAWVWGANRTAYLAVEFG